MGLWVRPIPRGGLAPPFPRSALGFRPEDPFRVAQRLVLDPSRWSAVEGGCPLQRRVECCASQDIPPARSFPGRREGWRPLLLHVRPRHHPGSGSAPTLPRRPGRVKAPRPKGTSIRPTPLLQYLQPKAFSSPRPLTRPRPRGMLALKEVSVSTLSRLEKRLKEKAEPKLTERLTIRLDKPTYEALESLAKEHDLSVTELAREALVMLADEYRDKRPEKQPIKQPSSLSQ